ncbi:uncharacterized protein LOC120190139 [Hibiscus syriacus]|uniref:uncharacterized protein LOC120190139 n=1 Tax=Hibiscus syriacus TaxID=106335 RepID=UPI001922EB51|nr:uncharacterized protein LOC120190139 [Hibiscus syriacus]
MVGTRNSPRPTHQPNSYLQSLNHVLDPISLILSLNSSPNNPIPLRLTTDTYILERGPRYRAYAELRETRLRMKRGKQKESEEIEFQNTQKKKLVKSSSSLAISRKSPSVLAPPVPHFSATLRKENRKQPVTGATELTPPGNKSSKEKKGRLMMITRKSCASIEELKRISFGAINGENRGKISGNR